MSDYNHTDKPLVSSNKFLACTWIGIPKQNQITEGRKILEVAQDSSFYKSDGPAR